MLHYASNVAKLFAKKYEYAIIIVYFQEAKWKAKEKNLLKPFEIYISVFLNNIY